jgi:hypothetical protein
MNTRARCPNPTLSSTNRALCLGSLGGYRVRMVSLTWVRVMSQRKRATAARCPNREQPSWCDRGAGKGEPGRATFVQMAVWVLGLLSATWGIAGMGPKVGWAGVLKSLGRT